MPANGDGGGASPFGSGTFCSGFEPPCFIGYIGGGGSGQPQNCDWHASASAQPGFTWPRVLDVDPLTGLQHLRFQYDPAQPQTIGSRNWAFSDNIEPTPTEGVVNLSLDLRITQTQGAGQNIYIIQPQAPSQALLTTVMNFHPNGSITAGDDNGDCADENFVPQNPTTGVWTPGVWHHVDICVDVPNDRIRYFLDGQMIYSTGAGEGGVGGPLGCGVFAGSIIEHVLIRYDTNFDDGTILDVDDVCIEADACPDPTGACCTDDGMGGLDCIADLTESECLAEGGGWAGIGTDCSVCPAFIECYESNESCWEAHDTGGCSTSACCELICGIVPFCCEVEWDVVCADSAFQVCGEPPLCDLPAANCQPFIETNASNSMPTAFQVADNFTPALGGDVTDVCWYGAYLPDDDATDSFIVRYYDCADGVPGALIQEFSESAGTLFVTGKQDTGFMVAGLAPIYEYVANHGPVPTVMGAVYFIEVLNLPPTGQTWFWEWADPGANGDGISFQKPAGLDYGRYHRQSPDVAFCLNIELDSVVGLCDLPDPVPCDLDTSIANAEENEPCGADPDLNLGCSVDPPGPFDYTDLTVSTNPQNPTVVHGESWADGGSRDIDWFRFTVPAGVDVNGDGEVTVCIAITSELPMQAVLVTDDPDDGECGAVNIAALEAVGFDCTASLAIGYTIDNLSEQLILVRSADGVELFNGSPCDEQPPLGLGNDYLLEVSLVDTFEECFPDPPDCPQDIDGDGIVGFADLLEVLTWWGPCP